MRILRLSLLCWFLMISYQGFAQQNLGLLGHLPYDDRASDIWGYVSPTTGIEYALVGLNNGFSIVDISTPSNPTEVHRIPGPQSIWRDVKTWSHYAYVTNDDEGGIYIVDLEQVETEIETTIWFGGEFQGTAVAITKAHNIFIDENGIGYIFGADYGVGGVLMIDIPANPLDPPIIGIYNDGYVHDGYVRNDTLWTAEVFNGYFSVVDVTEKANPIVMATQSTPNDFTHNIWVSDDGKYAYTTDEKTRAFIAAYDVSDITDIKETDRYQATPNSGLIPHNTFVVGNFLVNSYYKDGVTIVDATYPNNLIEVGHYDTSPSFPSATGFSGCWGVYPYSPNGYVLASDIEEGLYIFQPSFVPAAYLEGTVTDAVTGNPIPNVTISIIGDAKSETKTSFSGTYATGTGNLGTYEIVVSQYGYEPDTIEIGLINGFVSILDVQLQPLEAFELPILFVEETTNQPIANAQVQLAHSLRTFDLVTDSEGKAIANLFYEDDYSLIVGKWGFETKAIEELAVNFPLEEIVLTTKQGYYDDFALDFNWTTSGTAANGQWDLADPINVNLFGNTIVPENDIFNDIGKRCFVTKNSSSFVDNVIDGTVTLTSPIFDATIFDSPEIVYFRWFYNTESNTDSLVIKVTNGQDTAVVENIQNGDEYESSWRRNKFVIADYVMPTSMMHFIVEAADKLATPGLLDVLEAGFDGFQVREEIVAPIASFEVSELSGCSPFSFDVANTTSQTPIAASWTISNQENIELLFETNEIPTITLDEVGKYTIELIVSNEAGKDTIQQEIEVFPSFNISLQANTLTCATDALTLTATSEEETATFEWQGFEVFDNELIVENPDNNVFVVVATNANGCTIVDSIEVTIPETVAFEVAIPTMLCPDSPATLGVENANGEYTYTWTSTTGEEQGASIVITPSIEPTTYQVMATNENGCTASQEVVIEASEITTATVAIPINEACISTAIELINLSVNADEFSWLFTNTATNTTLETTEENPIVLFEEAGLYNLQVIANGCTKDTLVLENAIEIFDNPTFTIQEEGLFYIGSTDATLVLTNLPDNVETVNWIGENIDNSTNTTATLTLTETGAFEYSAEVITENGCSNIQTIIVQVLTLGVEEATDFETTVYPNPTAGQLTLAIEHQQMINNLSIQLFNTIGQQLLVQKHKVLSSYFQDKLDVTNYPTGIYYLELTIGGQKQVKKIIVQ